MPQIAHSSRGRAILSLPAGARQQTAAPSNSAGAPSVANVAVRALARGATKGRIRTPLASVAMEHEPAPAAAARVIWAERALEAVLPGHGRCRVVAVRTSPESTQLGLRAEAGAILWVPAERQQIPGLAAWLRALARVS